MGAGAVDGYFARATRERHAMTWTGPQERRFEMPTGGFAYMNKGENLCYFRKKEQAIALSKNLRKLKINDIKIYRIKKDDHSLPLEIHNRQISSLRSTIRSV